MTIGFVLDLLPCSASSTVKALSMAWSILVGLVTAISPLSAGIGVIDNRLTGSPCWAAAGHKPTPNQTDAIKTESTKREGERRKISSLFWQGFIGNNLVNSNCWGGDLPV